MTRREVRGGGNMLIWLIISVVIVAIGVLALYEGRHKS